MPTLTIPTARTRLTILQADQSALLDAYQIDNLAHLAPWEPVRDAAYFTPEATRERIETAQKNFTQGLGFSFAVLTPDGSRMVAACNFNNLVRGAFQACYMGYSVAKACEGQGLMFEAVQAGIAYMFDTVGLHRIIGCCDARNGPSAAVLRSLGMRQEAHLLQAEYLKGEWCDELIFAILEDEWRTGAAPR